jgi:hypothetical protein
LSDFKTGDRVRVVTTDTYNGKTGTIKQFSNAYTACLVALDGDDFPARYFDLEELVRDTPAFIKVETYKSIWLSFPGESVGRKLSVEDATTLLRQLDEALS